MLQQFRQGAPLCLAALLLLGACDDPPDEKPVVKIKSPSGVKVEVELEEKKDDAMVIAPEGLALVLLISGLTCMLLLAHRHAGSDRRAVTPILAKGRSPLSGRQSRGRSA